MTSYFNYIYALPIYIAVILIPLLCILLATSMYYISNLRLRLACSLFLIIWILSVFDYTVFSRNLREYNIYMLPFESYFHAIKNLGILRSNFMNILLFFPGGMFLTVLLPETWKKLTRGLIAILPLFLLSVIIEFCQYYFSLGQCETDDVIHNTLGAVIGFFGVLFAEYISKKDPEL